jgi:hypothetical protein
MNVDRETIQNRSTEAVFERGENYRDEGRIQRLERFYRSTEALIVSAWDACRLILSTVPSPGIDDLVTAAVSGSKLYDVTTRTDWGFSTNWRQPGFDPHRANVYP